MSFTINRIVLYSLEGKLREVRFKKHGLNVITGESKTGKSAIIDIIEYCLGREDCYVAEGVIKKHVSWFALEISHGEDCLFIARRNPGPTNRTNPEIFIRRGSHELAPEIDELQKNITREALIVLLSRFTGISENEHRPLTGTRLPLEATIRHALFLCFQTQDEIDSRERLFHRQGDPFIPQAIKDTIPYFLGAIDETHFLKQAELDIAKKELQEQEARVRERGVRHSGIDSKLDTLLLDIKRTGLLSQSFENVDNEKTIEQLRRISSTRISFDDRMSDFGDTVTNLKNEVHTLQNTVIEKNQDILAARSFLSDQSDYSRETSEQHARLRSIELYKPSDTPVHSCPLCEHSMDSPIPSILQITNALEELRTQMSVVNRESPHLQDHIKKLETQRSKLVSELGNAQTELGRIIEEDAKLRAERDFITDRAVAIGRIKAVLDNIPTNEDESDYQEGLELARQRVEILRSEIDKDEIDQKIATFLRYIDNQMTKYSKTIDLEYQGSNLRLDLKLLTVVVDTESGGLPLYRMGSGENWVGYHVLVHMALHWWLRKQDRPCPRFIVFDQPSQAHYPAEADQHGKLDPLNDSDRHAVHSLFKLMYDACNEIKADFQVIVLDHAHIHEKWFDDSIIQEWRGGEALIPQDWQDTGL